MTVQELINELQKIEDKTMRVEIPAKTLKVGDEMGMCTHLTARKFRVFQQRTLKRVVLS